MLHDKVLIAAESFASCWVEPTTFKLVAANGRKTDAFKRKTRVGPLLDPGYVRNGVPIRRGRGIQFAN